MQNTILIIHIIVGILFTIVVLMQDKGVGFGGAIGGVGGGSAFYSTKRGAAKILGNLTVLLAALFLLTALVYVVVPADATAPATPTVTETSHSAPATTITATTEEE